MLSIIVLAHNRLDFTKQTIKALIEKTTVEHNYVFVDNCSTDGTKDFLKLLKGRTKAKKETIVLNKYNYGVSGGKNAGLLYASGDYIAVLDNDIVVPDNYDKNLIAALDKINNLGTVGVSVEKTDYPIITQNGISIQYKPDNIGGGFIALKRDTFNRVGYFSCDYKYGIEDCDYFLRIKLLGLINGYILDKGIHLGVADSKQEHKLQAHGADSKQVKKLAKNYEKYVKSGNVFVPYSVPVKFNKDGSVKW